MLSSPAIPFRHAEPVLVDASGPAAGTVPAAVTTATPVARPTAATAGDPPFSAISFPTLRAVAGDNTLETARVQGHAAGYTAGMRAAAGDITAQIARLEADHAARVWQVQAQLDRTVGLLTAATHALDERTQPVLLEVEDTLLATALDLAEAVIGYELSDGVGAARLALRRALDPASPTRPNVVRMHPADLAVIDPAVLAATGVQFQADPSLDRGDAVSEFADGFLDARIGTAFERARAALLGGTR
ncbi:MULTISPECIES: FliH/SctL family protein [unclassified Cryobacterium]|uniref:FliH/SctL family protein n=1 Tax=unclassified Cryobacterium TaxID=2649013 RepID=UPI002AB3CDC3|nr:MULTISPECIES: FliH/SctL family protein [unclassified Cryobacterium]MDY7543561.1 FliH/SctL family protein [Cryobacterium sp. 5B3]MEA9999164.1 FliH/SctL family protein [Cryobacterium sp. RTS3]MEB0266187.1 FliH/SctL family protein [Cryobacterium sp. 10I5]MEB0273081.1 FliH/SctL family protein [Cryobacterium sp. 5B3]